jgi:WD40 repeat protein
MLAEFAFGYAEHGRQLGPVAPRHRESTHISEDNTARVWDAASGRCLAVLQGHTDSVTFGGVQSRWPTRRHRFSRQNGAGLAKLSWY